METISISLTKEEKHKLDLEYPEDMDLRAIKIITKYLSLKKPGCTVEPNFSNYARGDHLVTPTDEDPFEIIIKGTTSKSAFRNVIFDDKRAYDSLTKHCVPLYIVTDVLSSKPLLCIAKHDIDFTLKVYRGLFVVRMI